MKSAFVEAVEREFVFLIEERGFELAAASDEFVRVISPLVEVRLSYRSPSTRFHRSSRRP